MEGEEEDGEDRQSRVVRSYASVKMTREEVVYAKSEAVMLYYSILKASQYYGEEKKKKEW